MGCVQSQEDPRNASSNPTGPAASTPDKTPPNSSADSSQQSVPDSKPVSTTDTDTAAEPPAKQSDPEALAPLVSSPSDSQIRSRSRSQSRLKPSTNEQNRLTDAQGGKGDKAGAVGDPDISDPSSSSRDRNRKARSRGRGSPSHSKSRKKDKNNESSSNLLTIHEPKSLKSTSVCRAAASVVRGNVLESIKLTSTAKRSGGQLNQYSKVKLVGSGATAKVHLYTNTTSGQEVAIKTFNRFLLKKQKMYSNDPITKQLVVKTQYDKVLHEIEVLKYIHNAGNDKLSHICQVYEIIDDPNHEKLYIVMEYGRQGPLAQWDDTMYNFTRTSLQTEAQARVIFLQVLKALVGLREIGVIHRDIKPQNIILTPTAAKIIDFGDAIVLPWKYPELAVKFQQHQNQSRVASPSSETASLAQSSSAQSTAAPNAGHKLDMTTPPHSPAPQIHNLNHTPSHNPLPDTSDPQISITPSQANRSTRPQQDPNPPAQTRSRSVSRSRSQSRINPEAFVASTNVMDMDELFMPSVPTSTKTPSQQASFQPAPIARSPCDDEFSKDSPNDIYRTLTNPAMEKLATDNFWYQHGTIKESAATPYFSSPESCSGAYNGFDLDLWAFACTIYACVCGQLPFLSIQSNSDATLASTLDLIQNGQFVWPVKVNVTQPTTPAFQTLIQWMLQKEAQNRPTLDMCEQHPWAHVPIAAQQSQTDEL